MPTPAWWPTFVRVVERGGEWKDQLDQLDEREPRGVVEAAVSRCIEQRWELPARDCPDPVGALMAIEAAPTELVEEDVSLLIQLGAMSRHLGRMAARRPEVLEAVAQRQLRSVAQHRALFSAGRGEKSTWAGLRRYRAAQLAALFALEAIDGVDVGRSTRGVSDLASFVVDQALHQQRGEVVEGEWPVDADGEAIPLGVVGLGKLGGRELNFSSDIDIVFLYGTDEGSCPAYAEHGRFAVHQFFVDFVQRLTRAIDEVHDGGRLWRVDLRLRPEGLRGPLVQSLAATEAWYEAWGRTFDRSVWVKARPIAGDLELGHRLIDRLRPFVYRRSLDHGALEELRRMKESIDQQQHQRGTNVRRRQARVADGDTSNDLLGWDVKVGVGGIREIEFIAVALQLVYGGRRPEQRTTSTLAALSRLSAAGLLPQRDAFALRDAYHLYRRIEHIVQMEGERQTQTLPRSAHELSRLARRLDLEPGVFAAELCDRRREVRAMFDRLLGTTSSGARDSAVERLAQLGVWEMNDESTTALAEEAGFARPRQTVGQLAVASSRPHTPFSPTCPVGLADLATHLLADALASADPDKAVVHLTSYLLALDHHTSYLQALLRNPHVRTLLMSLFGLSDYLSTTVARRPELLDVLLGSPDLTYRRERDELLDECRAAIEQHGLLERKLETLADLKQRHELRLALADLAGILDTRAVGRELTGLAQAISQLVLELACHDAGMPSKGFALLGMGSFGAGTMLYGSDLDVIFVYEGVGAEDATRLARRTIGFLTTSLRHGPLYSIDTRLRPGGRKGSLVVTVDALARYHETGRAHSVERAALTRARPLAGDPALQRRLTTTVRAALWDRPVDSDRLCDDLRSVAQRAERELAPRRGLDLKSCRGGIGAMDLVLQGAKLVAGVRDERARSVPLPAFFGWLASRAKNEEDCWATLERQHQWLRRVESRLRLIEGSTTAIVPTHRADRAAALARSLGISASTTLPPAEALERSIAERLDIAAGAVERAWSLVARL